MTGQGFYFFVLGYFVAQIILGLITKKSTIATYAVIDIVMLSAWFVVLEFVLKVK